MQLNIKNSNPNISMQEKKSNVPSIIISIIAILLILGGVYLINQSFIQEDTSDSTSTAASTNADDSQDTEVSSSPDEEEVNDSTTSTNDQTDMVEEDTMDTINEEDELEEDVTDTTNTEEDEVLEDDEVDDTASEVAGDTLLAENESIIRVTEVTPSEDGPTRYDIEIIQTGFESGVFLKEGATTYLNLTGASLEADKVYRISSITEVDGRLSITGLVVEELEAEG